jgi:hypothetical protein
VVPTMVAVLLGVVGVGAATLHTLCRRHRYLGYERCFF